MKMVQLSDVCDIVSGATPRTNNPAFWDGDIPWATPTDVSQLRGRKYIETTARSISIEGLRSCAATVLPAGSVLLSSRAPIGHVAINLKPMATNQGFKSLVPRSDAVDASYLYHWLRANRKYLESLGNGATFKEISKDVVSRIVIPLPPLSDQRRIADLLDRADTLRAKQGDFLGRLGYLTQSLFLDMFGDPRQPQSRYDMIPLSSLGDIERGVSKHRPRNAPELLGGPYPLIQTGDVARSGGYIERHESTYSEIGLAQSKLWPKGTLCITIAANIAKTGILEFDACFPDSVVGFTADPATTEYVRVWFTFMQDHLERVAPVVAQKNINLAILREFPIAKPPRPEVEKFAAAMRHVKSIRQAATRYHQLSTELFESLQARAFRGEL